MSNADPIKLKKKFPSLGLGDIQSLIDQFSAVDISGYGSISENEALKLCQQVSDKSTYDQIRTTIKECETNANGTIEIEEFFEIVQKLKSGTAKGVSSTTNAFNQKVITVKGSNQDTAHSINEDEKYEFATHINQALVGDPDLGDRLPIDPNSMQLFDECKDGLVLSKLINTAAADTIDERVLNVGARLNAFKMTENNNLVINSAKAIGCSVVNIGSKDLIEGREHLILGLIWQIIKIGLLAKIDIKYHPELYRLLEDGETLEDFLKLPAEHILLRWFNYHLKNAGWDRRVTNFSKDVKDGQNYTVLLNQLSPSQCSLAPLKENDLYQRAEMVLQNADALGCRKYLSPKTLVGGNPKLNLAFVAHLFNTHPCLEPLTEQEAVDLIVDEGDDREARAFTLWLNSLNVDPYVNNLYLDVRDGIILLQAIDRINAGAVNWKAVNKPKAGVQTKPLEELEDGEEEEYVPYFARGGISRFKQIENTNYLIELGKQLNFSLVGIQGADITDGQKTLILGLVWQLMRAHVVSTLKSLGSGGRDITDTQMIKWANEKVAKSGKSSKIANFRDSSLRSARYLLDLLDGMRPGIVDYSLVNDARTDEDAKQNALYAISIARKMNATIFLLPEDIVEVKPKMILTFVGSLMAIDNAAAN